MARQAHVQGAAEAFVMWLSGRVGHDAVGVEKLPAEWNDAALHSSPGFLTHKTRVNAWKKQKQIDDLERVSPVASHARVLK